MIARQCDICRGSNSVRRYGLTRQARLHETQSTTYGRGGIDMCDPCWERIAQPRTKPQRAHAPTRTVTVLDGKYTHTREEPTPI